jgi:pilus assembly protein CpaB
MAQAVAAGTSGTAPEGRNRLLIVGAIVFGLITAVLLFTALQNTDGGGSSSPVQITTASVLVVSRDVEANTLLTADMLEVRSVPVAQALSGGYEDVEAAVGLPLRYPLQSGEQVTTAKVGISEILDEGDLALVLEPGQRAFAIRATEVSAVGGNLLPGNLVDIIAVFRGEDGEVIRVGTPLENVAVLGVAQEALEPVPAFNAEAEDGLENSGLVGQRPDEVERQPRARSVTLAVTPDQVQLLAGLQTNNDVELWLSLRPVDDESSGPQGTLSGNSLQFPTQ